MVSVEMMTNIEILAAKVHPFITFDNLFSFYGQDRSRSDCTEGAV